MTNILNLHEIWELQDDASTHFDQNRNLKKYVGLKKKLRSNIRLNNPWFHHGNNNIDTANMAGMRKSNK